ncbi:MAG: hypothetical protein ACXABY_23645 [Candidatus Thorarchaeota archaeon]|jgi:hypothetical protein
MSEFLDYDPVHGLTYSTDYDPVEDKIILHSQQDLTKTLEHCETRRNENDGITKGDGFWLYCTVPAWLELELREKGINIHDKNCTKDFIKEINQNYPKFKYTTLHHEG